VDERHQANPTAGFATLGERVAGRADHIAATVTTLFLASAGRC
jgi:hypothetical protein